MNPLQGASSGPGTRPASGPIFPCLNLQNPKLRSHYFHIAEKETEVQKVYVARSRSAAGEQLG